MGTHGVLAVTKKEFGHKCVERTLDGDMVVGLLYCIVRGARDIHHMFAIVKFSIENGDGVGEGGIECGEEREHGQEYYVHFNFDERYIGMNGIFLTRKHKTLLNKLFDWGWDIYWESDCEDIENSYEKNYECCKGGY